MAQHGEEPGSQQGNRQRALAIVGAVAIGISSAAAAWLFTLSLREMEVVGALLIFGSGVALIVRWGIHIRLGYLEWPGTSEQLWGRRKRDRLFRLTLTEGGLGLALTVAGLLFFLAPGGLVQLLTLIVLLVFVYAVIEATRDAIESPGGPPPGSDVIENCGPVRYVLNPKRIWNGKWGLDSGFRLIVDRVPVGHRNKVAVLLICGLALSMMTQAAALVGRVASHGRDDQPPPAKDDSAADKQANVEASASNAEVAIVEEPTYDDNCGTEVSPGDGAPEPLKRELRIAWEELSPADGCSLKARPVAQGRAYLAVGQCQGVFWSLGIASWEHPAAVLIEGAAVAAKRISRDQELLGASPRVDIGMGDFHLVYTPAGPFLLIREQKTDGNGGPESKPESCADIEPGGERYTVLPPGMAELWLRFNEEGTAVAWPATDASLSFGRQKFTLRAFGGVEVAEGHCVSPVACVLDSERGQMTSSAAGAREVTVRRIVQNIG